MNREDEDREEAGEESFAELLAQSLGETSRLEPGQKTEATVVNIAAEWIFLDIGQKGEGVIDRKELLDAEGTLTVQPGDRISAYFLGSSGGEMRFTTRLTGSAGLAQLEEAWRSGIPVEGTVEKETKGGYEVRLAGSTRAFCPYSQSGQRRTDPPEQFIGRHLPFRITQYAERGRNIVLSHREIVEEERQRQREALRETLREGMTVRGTVSSLQKFGAFVDIGGVEGLIPMSELGWGRVENISEVLQIGQEVEVTVKQLDWEKNRISFSLKEASADPWLQVPQKYPAGSVHNGTVARLTPFGAFVTLEPGIDGLVHISRLGGGKKLKHPKEAVAEGQTLSVQIESVDRESRRLSLVPAGGGLESKEASSDDFRRQAQEGGKSMGTLGDLLKAKLPGKKN
ncbi:MAG: 30S ribosomal protein S1 [Desulfuromonadales bacterium]|nr:30S ribosomal protein S1 [Desulfuromonadales bacterium]